MVTQRLYNDVKGMLKTLTGERISVETGLSPTTISKIKNSNSLNDYKKISNPFKPKSNTHLGARVSNEIYDKIKSSIALGFAKTAIAKAMSVSVKTIYNVGYSKDFEDYRRIVKDQMNKRRIREFPEGKPLNNDDTLLSMLATIENRLARIESDINRISTIQ